MYSLLYRTCADIVQTDICQHDDEDRAIVGTYTTEEIKACIPLGYRVITIYHVWHYTESSQYRPEKNEHGVFSKFVNTFNKMKMAASGFPAHVETDLQKRAYVKTLEAKDKIKLDVNEINNTPGLRNISKLLLNSGWQGGGVSPTTRGSQELCTILNPTNLMKCLILLGLK